MARFEGSIALTSMGYQESDYGKICAAIVGPGGSGTRMLSKKFPGLFVKVYDSRLGKEEKARVRDCDSIHISGRSQGDVQEAAGCISVIAKDAMDGTLSADRGPKSTATCPSAAVGAVIGSGGSGLKTIQQKAGDHCHVHYDRESALFEISASTQVACDRAKIYIGNSIKEFFKPKEQRPPSRPTALPGFLALSVDDYESDDELSTAVYAHKTSMEQTAIIVQNTLESASRSDSSSIQSRKGRESSFPERMAISEELSKKTDPKTGTPLYPSFNCQWRGWVSGAKAVPRSAVDEAIKHRRLRQQDDKHEEENKRAKLDDAWSQEQQRHAVVNGLSNDSLFPALSSGKTKSSIGWGLKPSSVCSEEGVEKLNQSAHRYVAPYRRKTNGFSSGCIADLTGMMPSAPLREMVDLSKMLLPTGPKLSRTARKQPALSQDDEYWLDIHLNQGGTEKDYYAILQEEEGIGVGGGDGGDDWWNN